MTKTGSVRFKRLVVFPVALMAFSMIAGCMNTSANHGSASAAPEGKPTEMAADIAKAKASQLSSQILKISGLRGKVTDSGPLVNNYGSVPNGYYVRHDWAIYGLPNDVLETGMKNLQEALPNHGWKVTSYGPAHSKAQQLQLKAEHVQDHYTVLIEWIKGKVAGDAPTASDNPEVGVTLTSPAYQAPAGSSAGTQP